MPNLSFFHKSFLSFSCTHQSTLTHKNMLHDYLVSIFDYNIYLARALPCASRSTVGTPSRTKRAKRDCSMLENFWKAMFLMTGGNWW